MRYDVLAMALIITLVIHPVLCWAEPPPIRVMCLGAVGSDMAPYISWFKIEPGITGHYVPARFFSGEWTAQFGERIRRSVRMYFPRSYSRLTEFDFLILDGPVISYFGDDGVRWVQKAIEEGEVSATTMASVLSKHRFVFLPFVLSELSQCFPVDGMKVVEYGGGLDSEKLSSAIGMAYSGNFQVRINRDAPPVFTPFLDLGLEKYSKGGGYLMFKRQGAFTWMWAVGAHPNVAHETPYLISWEYGKGITWSLSDNMRMGWWGWKMPGEGYDVSDNPYGLDVLVNWIRYATGREPIKDISAFHNLRVSYGNYEELRSMAFSIIDFVSKFGGKTSGLESSIREIDRFVERSKEMYVRNDLEGAEEEIDIALEKLDSVNEEAMKLKDRTFLWIYVTQWLVVTSTTLICGFVLWSFMVRRRAFREVSTTRGQKRSP